MEVSINNRGDKNRVALLAPKKRPPLTLPKVVAAAWFRLATGHDYFRHHLKRIALAESPECDLRREVESTAEHTFRCPATASLINDKSYVITAAVYWV